MSRYTRFRNTKSRFDTPPLPGDKDHRTEAERVFSFRPARPLTHDERTAQIAKQIVREETEKRQRLAETLRAARLERAGRFTENARKERESKKDQ